MKQKLVSLLLVLCISIGLLSGVSFAMEIVDSGTCGTNLNWTLDDTGTLTISGTGAMTDYTYPSSVPWYSNCDAITNVVIGNNVTTIGDYAFSHCEKLETVTIGSSVTTIGKHAFNSCSKLKEISLPDSVTTIGANAFDWCWSLESVTLGKNLETIGDDAFNTCKVLKSITIPDSVTTIGELAFSNCYALERAVIGSGVTTLDQIFNNCHGLKDVTIGENVETIGNWSFSCCDALERITIPNSVSAIGHHAFYNCTVLTDVYYNQSKATWDTISIANYNDSLTSATIHFAEPEISISTVNGAQVRTRGKQGLRFISTLSKSGDFSKVTEYGTILIPTADITDVSEFVLGATLNGHAVAKVPAKHLYEETETSLTFTAVITDIKPKNYNRAYSARAYAILEDGTVVYSDVIPSRDVYSVAEKVLSNEELDADATAFLQSVLRYVDGITISIGIPEPKEDAQVPLEIEIDGCEATIGWTTTGGAAHTGTFESGTTYTATVTLTSDILFSPNDKVLWNNESIAYTLSDDGKTITVIKSYDFKDSGYSGIY